MFDESSMIRTYLYMLMRMMMMQKISILPELQTIRMGSKRDHSYNWMVSLQATQQTDRIVKIRAYVIGRLKGGVKRFSIRFVTASDTREFGNEREVSH